MSSLVVVLALTLILRVHGWCVDVYISNGPVNMGRFLRLLMGGGFFESKASPVIRALVPLKRTVIDCAHIKCNSHVNFMKQSLKIWKPMKKKKKRLSFIFHLFVKSLINISDVWLATVLKLC